MEWLRIVDWHFEIYVHQFNVRPVILPICLALLSPMCLKVHKEHRAGFN